MPVKIKPTRTNLLKTKEDLKLAKKGHELLQQKREVLMIEFMAQVHSLKRVSQDIQQQLSQTLSEFREGIIIAGEEKIERLIKSNLDSFKIDIHEKGVMGVYIPHIEIHYNSTPRPLSLIHSNYHLDLTSRRMRELIPLLMKWTEIYISIKRLAEEIKKNNRRVNALSNIFIPDYQHTIKRITDILDELEKEEFFRLKKVKSKLNQKKES
ncbi:MAG: V-type ATP synthase subunit D [Candidatus Delongbacteria bacterium]|nr:V-type ATP synthase subunit D [Candidatus Delongbacteria bacterium]